MPPKKRKTAEPAAKTKLKKARKDNTKASTSKTKKSQAKKNSTAIKKRKAPPATLPTAPSSPPPSPPGLPPLEQAQDLLKQVEFALLGIQPDLEATQRILEKHHPPTILAKEQKATNNSMAVGVNNTGTDTNDPAHTTTTTTTTDTDTGGHSNTNHQVVLTGDPVVDKLREYQRHYQQRQRLLVPETKGNDRWDKPKVIGQRRRRIHRAMDSPSAPNEPPPVGYTVFVGQMTTKIRHDRSNEVHHQPTVMQEIAKLWKNDMTEEDRNYYNDFAKEARREYIQQQMEYRASGTYTPSVNYIRLGSSGNNTATDPQQQFIGQSNAGGGPWIKKNPTERNALEQEIATYDTVEFPPRPPALDEDYQWRDWRSKVNRKLKIRKLLRDYNNPIEQAIVANAIDHAKQTLMDAANETILTVDHSAILAAATQECVVKLKEMKRAQEMADCGPPNDHDNDNDDPQQAVLQRMRMEDDARGTD